jgi:hypothetical protein
MNYRASRKTVVVAVLCIMWLAATHEPALASTLSPVAFVPRDCAAQHYVTGWFQGIWFQGVRQIKTVGTGNTGYFDNYVTDVVSKDGKWKWADAPTSSAGGNFICTRTNLMLGLYIDTDVLVPPSGGVMLPTGQGSGGGGSGSDYGTGVENEDGTNDIWYDSELEDSNWDPEWGRNPDEPCEEINFSEIWDEDCSWTIWFDEYWQVIGEEIECECEEEVR